ncbi:hypothetical protein O181_026731 [Austropuccinia psidii MF-1]|uniref:Integrase catalytic domain-containing protein n=1 Tax=Austropuccinia psidii MF-1 TaxID=1389203 RepID=A0A9Q3H0S6_9BASI|nr:hypothetical protein [Austropuccinia psidii MF-1]
MTTLKIPIQGGHIIICDMPFSEKISGTILSVGHLCRAGVMPLFSKLKLSLLVNHFAVATPFSLSSRKWHERLGNACDKVVISFLKQHVPTFDTKQWQPFFCKVCARAKSTHRLARAHTEILKEKPLELLVLDIMGPFNTNVQGFRYILTVQDHVSTYSIVYPLKSRSKAPQAIINCITQLQVRLCLTPRALWTDNTREFTSSSPTDFLTKMGGSTVQTTEAAYDGGWLLWDLHANKLIQLASVIFPQFQPEKGLAGQEEKGALPHILDAMALGEVRTEKYLADENKGIFSLPLAKDIAILYHLGQALAGSHKGHWITACLAELDQMKQRDVWEVVNKTPGMKTIGHQWVFYIKRSIDGTVKKFKSQMVARGDRQCPGVDCMETYSPTALLMSL